MFVGNHIDMIRYNVYLEWTLRTKIMVVMIHDNENRRIDTTDLLIH